ncbi:hypothetical protein PR003_g20219 [Phytophthora rubi]|uniref:Uncharacterized protein n=1 Tax=Phytophthora rubi TaxID=129364 RepID=A0A6A4DSG8_9STRA|nr:hypothetical protein PR003_g20219 [Phytophthora rubi]
MTSLLSVVVVLPPELRDLPHVVDLVTNLLMPETIDAAVYNDLQRVIREYGEVRPWTIGAMDGAAVRGRLDILQWLHTNRTEGCSVEAFTDIDSQMWLGS